MKFINKILIPLLISIASFANADPLNPNGPEVKQLEAMGYEVTRADGGTLTIASLGTTRIVFEKNSDRLVMFRIFTANTKKTQQQRLEIFEILNKININNSYQASLEEDSMNIALYKFGPYDSKTLAMLVRQMERANSLFDVHPKLIELLK
jgi:hypothetical protein